MLCPQPKIQTKQKSKNKQKSSQKFYPWPWFSCLEKYGLHICSLLYLCIYQTERKKKREWTIHCMGRCPCYHPRTVWWATALKYWESLTQMLWVGSISNSSFLFAISVVHVKWPHSILENLEAHSSWKDANDKRSGPQGWNIFLENLAIYQVMSWAGEKLFKRTAAALMLLH